jgi:hypothetical protein
MRSVEKIETEEAAPCGSSGNAKLALRHPAHGSASHIYGQARDFRGQDRFACNRHPSGAFRELADRREFSARPA